MPKPLKVEFSPTALGDLEDIADYIARDNPVAAEDWVATLVEAALNVAGHPRSGRVVPEVQNAQIRELIVRGYRVVYRIEAKRLVVLTVVEGHRRLKSLREP